MYIFAFRITYKKEIIEESVIMGETSHSFEMKTQILEHIKKHPEFTKYIEDIDCLVTRIDPFLSIDTLDLNKLQTNIQSNLTIPTAVYSNKTVNNKDLDNKAYTQIDWFDVDKDLFDLSKLVVYTDGGLVPDANVGTYGLAVYCNKGQLICTVSGNVPMSWHYPQSRNISSECYSFYRALLQIGVVTKRLGISDIPVELVYDYEGLGEWYAGNWKAKKAVAMNFIQFSRGIIPDHLFDLTWVKGHEGVMGNELADTLAERVNQFVKANRNQFTEFGEYCPDCSKII